MGDIKRLIFDADDTLWENNIYYLRATEAFFHILESAGFERPVLQREFDHLEIEVVREKGYGSMHFVHILEVLFKKYDHLNGHSLDKKQFQQIIDEFNLHPRRKPALFPAVRETMLYLGKRFQLFVLTKGERDEQEGKIRRSGLIELLEDYFILPEKDDTTFRDLLAMHNWHPDETCMIGNSPKSDINPALRNRMHAVFIPYRDTWKLDNEPISDPLKRLKVLDAFADLQRIF